ncbi:hypothetical protein HVIM_00965 [Roseomonas mucosa]|uniref:Uncharacterized protein n=1 Tax=Roseomonas mucosa TaxID=207340 RepID=A0A379N1N8_9PROT|nr:MULTISPECIES: hypothetical protein [Roseomonas]MBS5902572.1 hypothetical protein [Acetobacteraceae bacterium]AWV21803.1 hypothetical protein RADP37_00965 [Roseomonas mucosa]MDT8275515.1 hypothetical protein [Roseomonas mucosa]MDT8290755.1 hypothetical protein [Roseomonas mucosa]MDT8296121.1 hypothetical protein [Roseomonas mucosa]
MNETPGTPAVPSPAPSPPAAPPARPHGPARRHGPDYLGMGVLLGVVAAILAIWWIFPALMRIVNYSDCIGSGRITGC